MKIVYWLLNLIAAAATALALLSIAVPDVHAWALQYEGTYATLTPYLAYLVFGAISFVFNVLALVIHGEGARFPYYCFVMTWAPVVLLTAYGIFLFLLGRLYWGTAAP